MATKEKTALESRIDDLEAERAQLQQRLKTIDALLREKYKDWHAAQFAARVAGD